MIDRNTKMEKILLMAVCGKYSTQFGVVADLSKMKVCIVGTLRTVINYVLFNQTVEPINNQQCHRIKKNNSLPRNNYIIEFSSFHNFYRHL